MSPTRWFGRDPALVLQGIGAFLTLLVGFRFPHLSDHVAAAIMAFISAAAAAWTAAYVKPIAPTLFAGVITAGAALASAFGLHNSQAHVAAITAFVAVFMAILTRPQQTYLDPTR